MTHRGSFQPLPFCDSVNLCGGLQKIFRLCRDLGMLLYTDTLCFNRKIFRPGWHSWWAMTMFLSRLQQRTPEWSLEMHIVSVVFLFNLYINSFYMRNSKREQNICVTELPLTFTVFFENTAVCRRPCKQTLNC